MDPIEDRDFIWYQDGCKRLGWSPLDADVFWPQYQRYRYCHGFLQAWETYRAQNAGLASWLQSLVLGVSLRRMRRERDQLGHLGSAVTAGRYGTGGSGVTMSALPPHPVTPVASDQELAAF